MEEVKIAIIAAVSEVFRFRRENPKSDYEAIIRHITDFSNRERDSFKKMAMISAAAKTASYIERNPDSTEKQVIRHVMSIINEITNSIELDE